MTAAIRPDDCFVLFADLQDGIVELSRTNPPERLRKGVTGLAKLAKALGLPFIVTAVATGEAPPSIVPEIGEVLGDYQVVYRTTADALRNTDIVDAIRQSGRKTLLVAGVATELAVQLPALSAGALGWRSFVVIDACGGVSDRTEKAALSRIEQHGGALVSVMTLAGGLAGEFSSLAAQSLIPLIFEMATA
jgi:nicotinamidase-related amidase